MNGIQIKLNFTRKIGNTRALYRIFCRRKNLKPFQDEFRIQRNISNVNESLTKASYNMISKPISRRGQPGSFLRSS